MSKNVSVIGLGPMGYGRKADTAMARVHARFAGLTLPGEDT